MVAGNPKLTRWQDERGWETDLHEQFLGDPDLAHYAYMQFGQNPDVHQLALEAELWGRRLGLPPRAVLGALAQYAQGAESLPPRPPVKLHPAYLEPGMVLETPAFVRMDPELQGFTIPKKLRVDYWNWHEGESYLVDAEHGETSFAVDYNTADFPEIILVALDPATQPGLSSSGQKALTKINRHRAQLGMRPLDPAIAGWTEEDLVIEAQRLEALGNPWYLSVVPNPSTLSVVYGGVRNNRHMVHIQPYSRWGEKAYGIPTSRKEADYSFSHPPVAGAELRLTVDDALHRQLVDQRHKRGHR